MISPFEATILGFLSRQASSRYEIMKAFQTNSIYWSGSPGAVYGAIGRLVAKNLLKEEAKSEGANQYHITSAGIKALQAFSMVPVNAAKLFLEPVLLRIKLRGLEHVTSEERIVFYRAQQREFAKAKVILTARQQTNLGSQMSQRLAKLALAQLELEEEMITELLSAELADSN